MRRAVRLTPTWAHATWRSAEIDQADWQAVKQVFDRRFGGERRRKRGEIYLLDVGTIDPGVKAS